MTADERVRRLTEGIGRLERRLRRAKRTERALVALAGLGLLAGLAAAGAPRKPEALRLRGLVILDRQGEPALVAGDDGDAGIGLIREEKDTSILAGNRQAGRNPDTVRRRGRTSIPSAGRETVKRAFVGPSASCACWRMNS